MPEVRYFDCRCTLGRTIDMGPDHPWTPEKVLAEMDHFGIHEALVLDPFCEANDPATGNARILELTRDHPRLHPAWSALMTHSRETPPPHELVAQMAGEGVAALYLFHGQFQIPLEDWAIGDLLEALQARRVPLFVCPDLALNPATQGTDWSGLVRICREFPELPIVLTEERIYGSQRPMYEALAACPNLRIDMTSIWLHRRIEFVCREFGAERLVFGSRLHRRTPGAGKAQLDYSDITEDELAAIAGGNMRELISWNPNVNPVAEVCFPPATDRYHHMARTRAPLKGSGFYDCHGHIGWGSNRHVVQDTPETVVAEMDRLGIDVICLFSFAGAMPDEYGGNDLAARMLRDYPHRFVAFCRVVPNRGEEEMLAELRRCEELGMRGVKLATQFQGYPEDGPMIDVAAEFANQRGWPMLHHHWGSAAQMRRLCETYPDAIFISGHTTLAYVEVARDCPNLFICTCPVHGWNQTEKYVEAYGADRMLFGSDLMDLPVAWGLGPILYARVPEADKRNILGGNLKRILGERSLDPR